MNWIAEVLERQVKEQPEHRFIFDEQIPDGITFREFYDLSGRVYAYLKRNGIGKECFVQIKLPRGMKPFIALMGVWRAGAAFVISEVTDPVERMNYIYQNSGCRLALDSENWEEILKETPLDGHEEVSVNDAAYAVYTSGTTGNPKGVLHEYGNLQETYQFFFFEGKHIFAKNEHIAFSFPLGFVITPIIFINTLLTEQPKLSIVGWDIVKDIPRLKEFLEEKQITAAHFVPSFIKIAREWNIPSLRTLMTGMEPALDIGPVEGTNLYYFYGMSESGYFICINRIDQHFDFAPVGKPQFERKVFLLNEDGTVNEEKGEICFENPYVRGYINLPEENERAFKDRIYHTNDLATLLPDGKYRILGRRNDMVKINGNRVEPAEVEVAVRKVLSLDWCAVRGFEGTDNAYLVAYYTADIPAIDIMETRKLLSTALPYYMLPSYFVKIDQVPLTRNGKLDRKALPCPVIKAEEIVLPETPFEKQMVDIVMKELQLAEVGVTTNLISMGLSSIRAIKLSAAIKRETGFSIHAGDILKTPYIRAWETSIEAEEEKIEVLPYQENYPITSNQLGIYLDWERNRESLQYNLPMALKLSDNHPEALLRALHEVIEKHPYYKVHFEEDESGAVVQKRRDDAELPVIFEKLQEEPGKEFFQSRVRPFDLLQDDLSRFEIYYTEKNTYLFFDIHHIIFDGTSINILLSDLLKHDENVKSYSGSDDASDGVERATAYDYALFYQEWLHSDGYQKAETYFETLLDGTEPLSYPSDRVNSQATGESGMFTGKVSRNQIKAFCAREGVTENAFFAAVLLDVLHRITREESIQISTISNGRSLEQLAGSIGMFVQTLPLVGRKSDTLRTISDEIISTIKNDKFPYTELVEKYNAKPNFLYAYQGEVLERENEGYEEISLKTDTAKIPLSLNVCPSGDNYSLIFEYDQGLYREEEIKRLSDALSAASENLAKGSAEDLKSVPLVSLSEAKELVALGTGEKLGIDRSQTIVDKILKNVKESPKATAVVDYKSSVTYEELDRVTDILANYLIAQGVKPDSFIAVKLPRIKEFLISVIGIWKAGCAYVPIDPEYPEDRIQYMIEDSQSRVVIDERLLSWALTESPYVGAVNRATPERLAYMIYTSGSTGKPKGVMVSHSSLNAFVSWLAPELKLQGKEAVAEYSSFSFDASVCDLYPSLASGSTLHILSEKLTKDFSGLSAYVKENHIIGATLPTQLGLEFLDASDVEFEYLILGGDKLTIPARTKTRIYNGYGPTEFTVWSSSHIIDFDQDSEPLPIGRPVPNSVSAIVDPIGNLLPRGVAGELALIGPQISRGYWNRPELTEEKFINCPFIEDKKMYRTGDLARWNEDGELMFLGRIDNQVKLRGFRIELGEVESALQKIEGIKTCVALVKTVNEIQHLVAYYVAERETKRGTDQGENQTINPEINPEMLRAELAKGLTAYMVPDIFVELDSMPMTPNGKINRKALPEPKVETVRFDEPVGEIEKEIASKIKDVLNLSAPVGRSDSFLSLGGDSIKSIRLVSKLRESGLVVSVADIMRAQTVKRIALLTKKENTFQADQSAVTGEVPLTAIQSAFFNDWKLKNPAHFNQSQMLASSERIDLEKLSNALSALVSHHDMLRAVYRDGKQVIRKPEDDGKQVIRKPENDGKLFEIDTIEADDSAVIEKKAEEIQASFDLENGPLLKALVIRKKEKDYLLLVCHHLVVDGVSWRILMEDLETAYQQHKLPQKTMSFKDWSLAVSRFSESETLKRELPYWEAVESQVISTRHTEERSAESFRSIKTVPREDFENLRGKALASYHLEINDILLAAVTRAYQAITGENEISIQLEGHGREPLDEATQIDRTVGWFTSAYPVVLRAEDDIRSAVRNTKETLRKIPNHGLGYGILKLSSDSRVNPCVAFNYLGTFAEGGSSRLFSVDNALPQGKASAPENIFGPYVSINAFGNSEGALEVYLDCDCAFLSPDKAEKFNDLFVSELKGIIAHTLAVSKPEKTASDFGENGWSDAEFQLVEKAFESKNEQIERIYPLTAMQGAMLLKAVSEPESSAYHISTRVSIDVAPTEEQVKYAFNKLLEKHEVFRSSVIFHDVSEPRQAIISGRENPISFYDLSDESGRDKVCRDFEKGCGSIGKVCDNIDKVCDDLEQKLFDEPIDLQDSPLARLAFVKTGENSAVLFFIFHHIIIDGWCNGIWLKDFIGFLSEAIEQKVPTEPNAPRGQNALTEESESTEDDSSPRGQFEHFVRSILTRDTSKAQAYWNGLLEGYETKTEIVPTVKVTESNKASTNEMTISLSEEATGLLQETCRKANCTINNAVEAALGVLLQTYNRTNDALFVKVVSGRDNGSEDLSSMVGICLNSVPVRIRTTDESTILQLLQETSQQSVNTNEFDWYPLSEIQAHSVLKSNLFQLVYAFENYEFDQKAISTKIHVDIRGKETNVSDLGLAAAMNAGKLTVNAKFDTDKFTAGEIRQILNVLQNILLAFAKTPEIKTNLIPLISDSEAKELVTLGTGEKLEFDRSLTVVDRILENVKKTPKATAIVDYKSAVTYEELDRESDIIANYLIAQEIKRDSFVGIKLPRIKEFLISVLGIWKAGCAYVPIDPEYPADRVQYMIEDSQSRVVIDERLLSWIGIYKNPEDTNAASRTGTVSNARKMSSESPYVGSVNRATPERLAYMIYTSGSTGKPKGVMVSHSSLNAFVSWLAPELKLQGKEAIAEYSSFSFDASVCDLYPSLASGSTLHILSEKLTKDFSGLSTYVKENKIIGATLPTQLGLEFLDASDVEFEYLILGGDKLTIPARTKTRIYNGYGPTEFTVWSSSHIIDFDQDSEPLPIGRPVPNSVSAIVDPIGNLLPRGVAGELALIGPQISRGYWNRPELTEEKFINCPFIEDKKMYRTGDLARWNEDGELMFLGRIDNQVKLRGFRIELGEVESALLQIDGIRTCVACVKKVNEIQHLVIYYVAEHAMDQEMLRTEMAKDLTAYMVPDIFVELDAMPMTPNGKINRKALPDPELKAEEIVLPESPFEKQMVEIVSKELQITEFGVTTNLISVGLTSIQAIKLAAAIKRDSGFVIHAVDILKAPYIRAWEGNTEEEEEKIEILPKQDNYPLTSNQIGIYLDWERNRDSLQYNVPMALNLRRMDPEKLRQAVAMAITKHPYLKTRIRVDSNGNAVQKRRDQKKPNILFEKLNEEPSREFFQSRVVPFNLLKDDLSRFEIYYTERNTYLFMDVHHIIFDGSSASLILHEIFSAYYGMEIREESASAFDYALFYNEWLKSEHYEKARQYFETLLEGTEPLLYPAESGNVAGTGESGICYGTVQRSAVKAFCAHESVTENAFFAAAFLEVLRRITREENIQISTISNGRGLTQLAYSVGMFVQTLPLVCRKNDTLRTISDEIIATLKNDKFPYMELAEKFNAKPHILYAYQGEVLNRGNEEYEEISLKLDTVKTPLSLNVCPTDDRYTLIFEYDRGMYTEEEIERLAGAVSSLAENLAKGSAEDLKSAPLVSMPEAKSLVKLGTGENLEYDRSLTIVDKILQNVKKSPKRTAVVDYKSAVTYEELDRQTNILAKYLIAQGVKTGSFVAVKLPRIKEFLISVIGIWKAGCAYVPIDPEYPEDRIRYMIEDSQSKALIDEEMLAGIDFSEASAAGSIFGRVPSAEKGVAPINLATPDRLAYMIYTSGSTGKPKGVMVSHFNLNAFISWLALELKLQGKEAIAEYSSFSFDASVCDLYPSLASGSTLHILSEKLTKDFSGLSAYIKDHQVIGMSLPTQLGLSFLEVSDAKLEYLTLGGDKLTIPARTTTRIYNGYGPTEFTVWSSSHIIDFDKDSEPLPIGKAVPNSISAIVDPSGNLLPRGAAGELALIGPQISQGYWNRPELTAEKFVSCPFVEGNKMYRTGDLARWNEDGELMFLGRIDNQVKLRGFRIELGEVESALLNIEGIKTCVACVKTVNDIQHLVAYYVAEHEIKPEMLRAEMAKGLTAYMVPDIFIELDAMPLSPNGKINRKALPDPTAEDLALQYVAPETETEKAICAIFGESLRLEKYSVDGDFFTSGGTSLLAIRAVAELQKQFDVIYGDIFKYKTPRALAQYVDGLKTNQTASDVFDFSDYDYSKIDAALQKTPLTPGNEVVTRPLGNVLLTGITGFLGIHILKYLLDTTEDKIYLLARPRKTLSAEDRVKTTYYYYFSEFKEKEFREKVVFIEGDITDTDLIQKLRGRDIRCVFNCAALVKHYVADKMLEKINTEGVRNLIECCEEMDASLIHMSTSSTGGIVNSDGAQVFDERHLYIGQFANNEYVRTKYLAERDLLQAVAEGRIRGKIMRLGNLMGRKSDGEFQMNFNSNAFVNLLKTYSTLGVFPESRLNLPVEMSPVDQVAKAIVKLAATPSEMLIFHPYNDKVVPFKAVLDSFKLIGHEIACVSEADFNAKVEEFRNDDTLINNLQGLLHYGMHSQNRNATTDNQWTNAVLRRLGFIWEAPDEAYFVQFLTLLDQLGLFD